MRVAGCLKVGLSVYVIGIMCMVDYGLFVSLGSIWACQGSTGFTALRLIRYPGCT